MTKILVRFLTVVSTVLTFAFATAHAVKPKSKPGASSVLSVVTKKYRSTKVVKIATSKKVTSELLGKTTIYEGIIYLSQGKFRWENSSPEQSLLLFDGSTIWNVQYPDKDLGGAVQVAKAKLDKNTKSQVLITTLLGTQPIEKNFHILSDSVHDGVTSILLKPMSNDLRVKELTLDIDGKAKLIRKISYKDDVDNLTVIELTKTDFLNKENKDLFKFKLPKGAQVTNL